MQIELDYWDASSVGSKRCSTCGAFDKDTAIEPRCTLRGVSMGQPDLTCCANQTEFGDAKRIPIGPVVSIEGDRLQVLEPSPKSNKVQDRLIAVLTSIDTHDPTSLSFAQKMALWQVQDFRIRRAQVHLDRIEDKFQTRPVEVERDRPSPSELPPESRLIIVIVLIGLVAVFFALVLLGFRPGLIAFAVAAGFYIVYWRRINRWLASWGSQEPE